MLSGPQRFQDSVSFEAKCHFDALLVLWPDLDNRWRFVPRHPDNSATSRTYSYGDEINTYLVTKLG